jgi:hypothetical protein
MSVRWLQDDAQGNEVEVARTVEHRIEIPNEHRPFSRYVQSWPFDRIPVPRGLPRLDAVVSARLEVPPDRAGWSVGVRSPNRTSVMIDGAPLPESGLTPGWHRVDATWPGAPPIEFAFTWGSAGVMEPIEREHLVPLEGSWPPARVWLWTLALTLAALLAWQLWRIALADRDRRRALVAALATAAVLLAATAYRAFDYDVMPEFRENGDELFAMWDGWSILHDGTTRGWSLWSGVYAGSGVETERHEIFSQTWYVISPYFEHPPLLHLLVGAANHLGGTDDWQEVRLRHGRVVPILLSILSVWLVVLVGRRLDPRGPAPWLGALLLAIIPTIVLQTRVIKEEALVAPLGLGMVYFFLRWREGRKTRDVVFAALCAGAAALAKVTGVAFVPALVMLIAAEKESKRTAWMAVAIGLGVAALFTICGA